MYILTFDIEEWFHLLDIDSLENVTNWSKYEVRIYENTYRILDLLKKRNLKATFFILGWVAEKYPDLIKLISDQGHEIGTHSYSHLLIYKSSPDMFRKDLRKSIEIIEAVTGRKVRAFRAPGYSIKKDTMWALKILIEEGIEYDSSIFPAMRGHGGIKDFEILTPFVIKYNNRILKEFPISVFNFLGNKIPFSGGGYFRLWPYVFIRYFFSNSKYVITYFHPRDFDPKQPLLQNMPFIRKFRAYYGLKNAYKKLQRLLEDCEFIDLSSADKSINWSSVPVFDLGTIQA